MRLDRLLRFAGITGLGVGFGVVAAMSCVGVDYPTVAFRCDPRQENTCPETHFCCSDDPAAEGGVLPDYLGKGIAGGTPFFSGNNNVLSATGMCVNLDELDRSTGLSEPNAEGCPIPCNPTWTEADIAIVCGEAAQCCQTVELSINDCVLDLDTNLWRPVTGGDINSNDVSPQTSWRPTDFETHQDPGGLGCEAYANGSRTSDAFIDCVVNLSVADQRGFCSVLPAGEVCPLASPDYKDPCQRINDGELDPPG